MTEPTGTAPIKHQTPESLTLADILVFPPIFSHPRVKTYIELLPEELPLVCRAYPDFLLQVFHWNREILLGARGRPAEQHDPLLFCQDKGRMCQRHGQRQRFPTTNSPRCWKMPKQTSTTALRGEKDDLKEMKTPNHGPRGCFGNTVTPRRTTTGEINDFSIYTGLFRKDSSFLIKQGQLLAPYNQGDDERLFHFEGK